MIKRRVVAATVAALVAGVGTAGAWEPSQPIELIVPAGEGGGAHKMAEAMVKAAEAEKLPVKMTLMNKAGGSGAEGYMYVKNKKDDAHTLVISLSSLFTLPIAMGTPFKWNEFTPIARMGLDPFILWVNAETPYKTVDDYVKAVKASPNKFKMAGTGSAQEDQVVTILLEQAGGLKFTYVPMKGGGDVAKALAAKEVDSTVNNPSEAKKLWDEGKVRPLGLFDTTKLKMKGWDGVPPIKVGGKDLQYVMMRGVFGPPGMPADAVEYYTKTLKKIYDSASFQEYLDKSALQKGWMIGKDFANWIGTQDELHVKLLTTAGLKQ